MEIRLDERGTSEVAVVQAEGIVIGSVEDALDLMASVRHQYECDKIIINKENICEDFFELRTRLAGEILQKYVNYRTRLAVVGDFSVYDSKSLHDFIYECNNGRQVFFVPDENAALDALHRL